MKCEVCKCQLTHLPFLWIALALDTHTCCSVDTDVKASNDFLRNKALSQLFNMLANKFIIIHQQDWQNIEEKQRGMAQGLAKA